MATPYTDIPRGGRPRRGIRPWLAGLVLLVLTMVVVYFAYTKDNPFSQPYELNAVFENVNDLQKRSPVRIAGVNVGKVTDVQPMGDEGYARVKMEIQDTGLPVREDATVKVRYRIFLEGNYFIDLHPGTPQSDEVETGTTIPPDRAASPVQSGRVLTEVFQRDTREDLQTVLDELSESFRGSGAKGFNNAVKYWEEAYKGSAIVSEATRGLAEGDLQRVLRGQARTFGALARDEEALKDLVTKLNQTIAAFARQEDNLKATIPQLRDVVREGRPTLRTLNRAFPAIRGFARAGLPAARSSDRALTVQTPFVAQLRRLVSRRELRGLVADLRPTVPNLVSLNRNSTRLFEQTRQLSSCQNNVLLPFSKTPIPDPDFPQHTGEAFYEESPRAFVGLAGESRLADANSPFFRVQAGGGPTTIVSPGETGDRLIGQALAPVEGVRPYRPTKRPVFRPGEPCENQEPPDLNAVGGEGDQNVRTQKRSSKPLVELVGDDEDTIYEVKQLEEHLRRTREGQKSVDPLAFEDRSEVRVARRLGLRWTDEGKLVPLEEDEK